MAPFVSGAPGNFWGWEVQSLGESEAHLSFVFLPMHLIFEASPFHVKETLLFESDFRRDIYYPLATK